MSKSVRRLSDHYQPPQGSALSDKTKANVAAAALTAYICAAGHAAYSSFHEPDIRTAAFTADRAGDIARNMAPFRMEAGSFTYPLRYSFPFRGEMDGVSISIPFIPYSNHSCGNGLEIGASMVKDEQGLLSPEQRAEAAHVTSQKAGQRICLDL